MTKLRTFLIGILIGQVLMIPHIIRWMEFPVVVALPVSLEVYKTEPTHVEVIKDVMTKYEPSPHPMYIFMTDVDKVRAEYKRVYGEDDPNLLGFYRFNKDIQAHVIYCARSPEVVAHEIRHAFEGSFHRSE